MRRELFYCAAFVAIVIVVLACTLQEGAYAYKFVLCVLATLVVAAAAAVAIEPVEVGPNEGDDALDDVSLHGVRSALARTGEVASSPPTEPPSPAASKAPLDDLFREEAVAMTREEALEQLCTPADDAIWSDHGQIVRPHSEDGHADADRLPDYPAKQYVKVDAHSVEAREFKLISQNVKNEEERYTSAMQRYNSTPNNEGFNAALDRYITTLAIETNKHRQKNGGGMTKVKYT